MRPFLFSLLALVCAFPALAQETEQRPMTTDDGLNLVQLGSVLLTSDGEHVLYGTSELNWDENKRETTYHLMPADSGEAYRFIGEEGGSDFTFSPEGTYLTFKRSVGEGKDKKTQLFWMRTTGGEAVQLTKHETSIGSYVWSEDESRIFFTADEPRSKEEEEEFKKGNDAYFVDEGPNGQTVGRWRNLWAFDVKDNEEQKATRLTKEDMIVGAFDVSPKGNRIVYTARTENRRNQSNRSELFVLDLTDSTTTRLTENAAPESQPKWSPDGEHIAYMASDDSTWELRNGKIWVINPETREARMISDAFTGNIRGMAWTPDSQSLLFNGLHRTDTNVYRLNVESGEVEQLTDVTGTLRVQDYSKDRSRMVYSFEDFDTPPDLYTSPVDTLSPIRLTNLNPGVEDSLFTAELDVIQWNSSDSLEIEGLLALPSGYDRSEPLPLLLHIHGGPAGVFTNSFRPQYHVWAGLGYAQLMPNVRGSSGYDDDLLRGNMSDIGGGDYQDLMTGVDHVIAEGIADPERLGVRGWSYGGILGGWTITQTDRFKAASIGAGVYDWTSEYGPGFNHDVRLWYIGGTPWDNPDTYRQMSALTHVKNVTTPTLLIHGMEDPVDTEPQSMMFFQALKDQGKTARYLRVPREKHGFREPRHQRARDVEEIRWMQKHVLGKDWSPWQRPKPKKDEEEAVTTAS